LVVLSLSQASKAGYCRKSSDFLVGRLHRIIHALLDGKELIAAQSFKQLPAEAFATPKRRQNEAESSAGAFSRCYV
jgi:hypothetical protein